VKILDKISSPKDLKKLGRAELDLLAREIREAILFRASKIGGHVASNLAMVEMTIALHRVFSSPRDKIILDVSHQCYAHKILTRRKDAFLKEEFLNNISGFTCPSESPHDIFKMGHTSSSVSLAAGMAKARDLNKENYNVIAIIGDGALGGGEALEGLSIAGEMKSNLIIIVNDNEMSIAQNHGGLYNNLKQLRESNGEFENNIFKAFNLEYFYEENGNDINSLIQLFKRIKGTKTPVLLHIKTTKGKGFLPAEQHKELWHRADSFNLSSPQIPKRTLTASPAALLLQKRMKRDKSIFVVTAGTPGSVGFPSEFRQQLGEQFVDLGIVEPSALSFIAAAAKAGARPVLMLQSAFLLRAADQVVFDLALNNCPATVILLENSPLSGKDATHMGIFGSRLLSLVPNIEIIAPSCESEYLEAINYAVSSNHSPLFIRAPRPNITRKTNKPDFKKKEYKIETLGNKIAIFGVGDFFELAKELAQKIEQDLKIKPTLINPLFVSYKDKKTLESLRISHNIIVSVEDSLLQGGFGESLSSFYQDSDIKVLTFGLKREFLDRQSAQSVLAENELNIEQILKKLKKILN